MPGLENPYVRSLAYVSAGTRSHELFAATNGDGVFSSVIQGTSIAQAPVDDHDIILHQNYPNPFERPTRIRFSTRRYGSVSLSVYNLRGQLVRVLREGLMAPGKHEAAWSPEDLSTGVYYYVLKTEGGRSARSLVLVH